MSNNHIYHYINNFLNKLKTEITQKIGTHKQVHIAKIYSSILHMYASA